MQSSQQLREKVANKRQEVAKEIVLHPTQRYPFMKTDVEKQQLKEHKTNYFGKLRELVGTKRPTGGRLRRLL